jgi:hypothetical protein
VQVRPAIAGKLLGKPRVESGATQARDAPGDDILTSKLRIRMSRDA